MHERAGRVGLPDLFRPSGSEWKDLLSAGGQLVHRGIRKVHKLPTRG